MEDIVQQKIHEIKRKLPSHEYKTWQDLHDDIIFMQKYGNDDETSALIPSACRKCFELGLNIVGEREKYLEILKIRIDFLMNQGDYLKPKVELLSEESKNTNLPLWCHEKLLECKVHDPNDIIFILKCPSIFINEFPICENEDASSIEKCINILLDFFANAVSIIKSEKNFDISIIQREEFLELAKYYGIENSFQFSAFYLLSDVTKLSDETVSKKISNASAENFKKIMDNQNKISKKLLELSSMTNSSKHDLLEKIYDAGKKDDARKIADTCKKLSFMPDCLMSDLYAKKIMSMIDELLKKH